MNGWDLAIIILIVVIFIWLITHDNHKDPYDTDVPPDQDPRYLAALGRAVARAKEWR